MSSDRRTFEKYQSQTEDAWDAGDDVESDFIHMTHDVKISRKDVKRTAMQVLSKHYEQTAHLAQTHTSALKSSPPSVVKLPTITKTTLASPTNSTDSTKNGTKSIPSKCVESPRPRYNGVGPGLGMRLMGQRSGLRQVSKLISPDDAPLTSEQIARLERFSTLLFNGTCDIEELRKQSWAGIPTTCRAVTWKILSGLVPPMPERRTMTLQRKRNEYDNFVNQYFPTRTQSINEECFRQIHIDVPRMSPLIALFQQQKVQEIFERILFIWAIRHPASGYVQGINDLVTPFFVVFLSEYVDEDCDLEYYPVEKMSANDLKSLEADCFWCFTKLLDGIQNNYTFAQPGIQENVNSLKKLISRIDADLSEHLLQHNVEYLQFAFRWMNNLLMREMSLHCIIRLWDTYLAEKNGFASFHVYVCAAFLMQFSAQIKKETDFQSIMMLLQCFPTQHWSEVQICEILAEAYKLQFIFAGAPKHTKP